MTERRKGGRPREFDGPPVSVRLPAPLHDDLSREAIRRDVDLSDVIRERLARTGYVSQNSPARKSLLD
jgi:hypothetical protein